MKKADSAQERTILISPRDSYVLPVTSPEDQSAPFSFILLKKANLTQTLKVGINAPTTENAHTETRKYLMLCLDHE